MNLKRIPPYIIGLISIIIFTAPIKEKANTKSADELIEVCDKGIVYVPQGTVFVKCHGAIKKVIKIESSSSEKGECNCPICCSGQCYVWISCQPILEKCNESDYIYSDNEKKRAPIEYCRLWLEC